MFWDRVELFQRDPFDPKLKLSGRLKNLWSFSIESDLRVIFQMLKENRIIFVDVGTHDEVY